ncbi:hypothetical protein ACKUB1_04920 [Methanospirillum stamsii]|uniref:Uncharacterized protein n=1 Tax=Methanospirillum stamsii TaxID=1277351 RepID=A0A2V2ND24_9EURY|nr:hypothetical protein [Methanospirillum stamsii]PWR73501.1 hypothetical protein DLD82_09650 [Methanospirillum stamsii]
MSGRVSDDALSEVIGFILIIAILVVIASLYVTYVVPAQGREAEIEHMTYIKDKFVDFKIALDSLWINQETNVSVSQNIEMGTLGQKTQGQFVFLPLANPVGSAGQMKIDNSDDTGTINITINGLFKEISEDDREAMDLYGSSQIIVNPDIYRQIQYYQALYPAHTKNMILIPISDETDPTAPDYIPSDPNDFTDIVELEFPLVDIYPNTSDTIRNWTASFELVRVPSFYIPNSGNNATFFETDKWAGYMEADYRYDLMMNLEKRNMSTGSNFPVFQSFTVGSYSIKPSSDVWINLQDPAYGLDASGPLEVKDDDGNVYVGTLNNTQNFDVNMSSAINFDISSFNEAIKSTYDLSTHSTLNQPMGNFSYTGRNYYWVNQEYTYQMGGVFLSQQDTGGSVAKVLPLLTLGTENGNPLVKITRLLIKGVNGNVAGTTPVQVVSQVTGIRKNIIQNDNYLAPSPNNARKVSITINYPKDNPEQVQMWANVFNSTVYAANMTSGFNPAWRTIITPTSRETGIIVETPGTDVSLEYTEVDVEILLQPVGWQGS